ncbi:hypothetical protein D9M71_565940 [compost metagenome]
MLGEILRGAAHHSPIGEQLDRHIVRVCHTTDPDAQVIAFADEINHAVSQIESQLQIRKFFLKASGMGRDVVPAKGGRCRNQQVALDHGAAATDVRLQVIKLSQQLLGSLEQVLSQFGQAQAACGAVHQLDPQTFLQRIQSPAKYRWRHALTQGRGSKTALLGNLDEAVQFCVTAHSIPFISTETHFQVFYWI